MKKRNNILDQIGWTPLIPIEKLNPNKNVRILAKLESFNPGCSVKDRPALFMIEEAERKGELTKDKIVLEATSGNTGIGLSMVSAIKGYRIMLVMSEAVSDERKKILRAMGAELKFTPAHLGTDGAIEYVYNLIREEPDKFWLADQFNNEANWKSHYYGTANEIWEQTGGDVNVIVSAMGTTGTLMGISRRFQELNPQVEMVGVEPYLGHKIQGLKNMKESYTPGIFERNRAHRIINIEDDEAYYTARLLAKKEGILVGMSSGAALAIALKIAKEMEKGTIVVIFPDGGERYLSTPLFTDRKKTGIRIYNTLTREKDEFVPENEDELYIYSCGPILSRPMHIGQLRGMVLADIIRRYLELKGYNVTHIMNVTDLDDRTIKGADESGVSLSEYTERFYKEFLSDIDTLGIKRATRYVRPSEHVDYMIEIGEELVRKGYAYEKLRSLYFDISRFKEYGRLSKIDLNKIKVGKTVDLNQYEKENPRDFTLFKRSTLKELKGGIFFKTRWGNVRPTWHLECPAVAMKFMDGVYDLHISGIDLIFPHNENSLAISMALRGKPIANYWIHNEMVMINGKKLSGSENSITLKDLLKKGYSGRAIRFWLLSRHYRKPLIFSWQKLDSAKNTIKGLNNFIIKLRATQDGEENPELDQLIYDLRHRFTESMDDDLNIAPALAGLFEFIHSINILISKDKISRSDSKKIEKALREIDSVLGIMDFEIETKIPDVEDLIKQRESARKNKDWKLADSIRDRLRSMGIEMVDTPTGTIWWKVK